jgi:hypothetical protein
MSLYLLPVNSLNFNALLATESISPGCFYERRKFGTKRFFYCTTNPHSSVLLIYDFFPGSSPIPGDDDSSVFYIGISKEHLDNLVIVKEENGQKVFACDQTIYLNFSHPIFVFTDTEQRNKIIAKSLSSLETKTLEKYFPRFFTLEDLDESIKKNELDISIDVNKFPLNEKSLAADKLVNNFKGLVYGNVISRFYKKTSNELQLQNAVRAVTNAWSAYASAVEYSNEKQKKEKDKFGKEKKYSKSSYREIETEKPLQFLNTGILNLIEVIRRYSPIISLEEKLEILYAARGLGDEELKSLPKIMGLFPEFKNPLHRLAENYTRTLDSELKFLCDEINRYHKDFRYIGSNTLERIQEKLNRYMEEATELQPKEPNKEPDIEIVNHLDHFLDKENKIKYLPKQNVFDEKQTLIYEHILNLLFAENKGTMDEVSSEHLNAFVANIGNTVKDTYGEESLERIELLHFYQFLNGKRFDFDINRQTSVVLSNFCAFILNHKSLEALLGYCERQNVPSYYLSLQYWGVFNGFAPLGKIYTKQLWSKEHVELTKQIDEHLHTQLCEVLPYLKVKPTIDSLAPKIETIQQKPKEQTFEDLLNPISQNSELQQFLPWVERCIETIVVSLSMEYDDMSPIESLQRSLESELYGGKGRPKGFNMQTLNKVSSLIDYELFSNLKKQKEKQGV